MRTVGRNFEGYFRDSFREFEGTTLPAYSQVNGYISQDVFVFTTDQLGVIYGSEKQVDNRGSIKYSCQESSAFQLKEIKNPTPTLHGLPTIELLTQRELESQTDGIKRALSGFPEKLVQARRVVETLSNIGEQIKIKERGGFLEDGNIATVWKLSGKEFSKDAKESIRYNLRLLPTIHEVFIGPDYSQ